MRMNGFDHCIIGFAERFGMDSVVAYDKWKVIETLKDEGMSGDQAIEYFYFNQLGAWVGELTPVFVDLQKA